MKLSYALLSTICAVSLSACSASDGGNGDTGGSTSGTASSSAGSSGNSSAGGGSGGNSAPAVADSSSSTGGSSSGGHVSSSSVGGNASGGSNPTGGSSSAAGGTSANGGSSGGGGSAKGGTSGAGGAMGGTSAGGGASSSGSNTGGGSSCDAPKAGVTIDGKKRFMYGVNFAWSKDNDANFGTDFGGFTAWNKKGVAAAKAARTTDMTDMKNNNVDIIRWWMFPSIGFSDSIKLDSNNSPTGLGGTVVEDINAALEIAASLNMHIKLTLFSFDNFNPDKTVSGVTSICIKPIVTDDAKRAALIANVVVPVAKAVEASPNKDRMIAWDVINEPEWATSGSDGVDQGFDPQASLSSIPYAQMETFVKDVVTALHANSKAPVTVGSAAVKWAKAWSKVGLDFYDFHWYGWVDQYFPHTKTPKEYGVDDKQVVVGEFPLVPNADTTGQAFGGIKYTKLIDDWEAAGYAGAQGWAFTETQGAFSWANGKGDVKAWAEGKCYVHY